MYSHTPSGISVCERIAGKQGTDIQLVEEAYELLTAKNRSTAPVYLSHIRTLLNKHKQFDALSIADRCRYSICAYHITEGHLSSFGNSRAH